jgi:hypothetical protein
MSPSRLVPLAAAVGSHLPRYRIAHPGRDHGNDSPGCRPKVISSQPPESAAPARREAWPTTDESVRHVSALRRLGEEPEGRFEVTLADGLDGNAGNTHDIGLVYTPNRVI